MALVTVLFFGSLRDITQSSSIKMDALSNLTGLIDQVITQFPAIGNTRYQVSLNRQLVPVHPATPGTLAAHALNEGDEIAFLPPFAGG